MANRNDINRGQKIVQVGQVCEVDTALPITVRKTVQIEQVREVDAALPINVLSTTTLLLQTVIVPGAKTAEGQLIVAVALPWFEIIELLIRDPVSRVPN